VDVLNVLR